MKEELKYLGLTLDGRLNFETHFNRLATRVDGVAARLLPNIAGSDEKVCRLYTEVVRSVILYGSPI